jgi:hypothetical protein
VKHEEMRAAIEIARQRCSLYSANDLAWIKRDGINIQRLGKAGVAWLLEQKVLGFYDEEYYVIDRSRCIELFIELFPDKIRQNPRFSSDQAMILLKYGKLADRVEEGFRLWMFFREIANAARLQVRSLRCTCNSTHCGLQTRIEYKSIPPTMIRDVW